jgi:hypothetical protein
VGWGSTVYARFTLESTYGTYNAAGTLFWARLAGDTAFSMMPTPGRKEINSADGGNRPVQNVSSRVMIGGKLRTPVYPTQCAAILGWGTSLTSNALPSYTVDWFDSFETRRYLGVGVNKLKLSCASTSDEGMAYFDLDLTAQAVSTVTLAAPAFSVFPTELPYKHIESSTGFVLHNTRTQYNAFSMEVANILKGTFDELPTISNLVYCGRTIDIKSSFQYIDVNDRTDFEAQTAEAASILFTKASPAHTLSLDWKATGRITSRDQSLPLGDITRQGVGLRAFYDATATTDFSFTET